VRELGWVGRVIFSMVRFRRMGWLCEVTLKMECRSGIIATVISPFFFTGWVESVGEK